MRPNAHNDKGRGGPYPKIRPTTAAAVVQVVDD